MQIGKLANGGSSSAKNRKPKGVTQQVARKVIKLVTKNKLN
jgi:hypothetical protein